MLRPNDGSATYQDLSLETIRKARRISRLTPNAGRSLVVRGFGDSCSAGRWRRVSTTHKRPASPPLEREPFVCARFSRQQEQRVCAPPSKKRKNTERVCGDPLLPLPVASLPPHSPVPWGVALTNTMAVLPLVPGQATRRCPRQPPMLRNPATPATGFRRVFLLFFLLGGLWETVPGVVAVFCTLASRGRSPCAWQCRCSALCCSRWCCAAGAPAFGSTGVCGGCSARPGSPSPPHRRRPRAPATGATGSRNPPKKGKTQKESVQNRCSVAGSFARASMGRPPIQQARVAAGSGTGERRCPRPPHRYPG